MTRTEIINKFIQKYKYSSYLEIGLRDPDANFNKIQCQQKISVDPDPLSPATFNMTSDKFFRDYKAYLSFDIIFIDGMHEKEQVFKDINNSLKHLTENGTILVHDCNPPTKWHTRSYNQYLKHRGHWNGNVWETIVYFTTVQRKILIKGSY